jgi:glutamate decarboxylase
MIRPRGRSWFHRPTARATTPDNGLASRYGNRFLLEAAPSTSLPETGMPAVDAMRLVALQLELEGDPLRNLATFVTTWMEPEAQH